MQKKSIVITGLFLSFISINSLACTSIGFAGKAVQGGGTIVAKNRDSSLTGYERLQLFKPKGKHSYIALTYTRGLNDNYDYITSGTNDAGLSIMANDAATNLLKNEDHIETTTIKKILTRYKTVDQVMAKAKTLFANSKPAIYLISDAHQVANVQVGDKAQFAIKVTDNSYTWNTNAYYSGNLVAQNRLQWPDIKPRSDKIKQLLKQQSYPITANQTLTILGNQDDGQFDGIQRMFTTAKYLIVEQTNQAPHLIVQFTIPTQKFDRYDIVLNKQFFNRPAGVVPTSVYGLLGSQNKARIDQFLAKIKARHDNNK
ncbi:MAG: carcinine hydrolase/isopenicillin-N N-acyltransferase family protein [Pseudomonadota bacterium]